MKFKDGIYPTMITPYKNGSIDYDAVRRLVDFYIDNGCTGIFAVCQSSEMQFLSLNEKVTLARTVVEQAAGRVTVVASGHNADSLEAQVEEANLISETGIDAFVLNSNRFDVHNDGDSVWLYHAEKFLERITSTIPLGIYECPRPYKRLLTPKILNWIVNTGRFAFIKDTCCDPGLIKERIQQLKGSNCKLYNANAQTLLRSLKEGANGYSGIMANFHPDLLVWLYDNFKNSPDEAQYLSDILSMAAFTEGPAYPCTAKYYMNLEGIKMDVFSRSADKKNLTAYQKDIMNQLYHLNCELRKVYCNQKG